jgi:hypothetical protein
MAENMAIIPMDATIAPECVKIVPAAVATGAGRSSQYFRTNAADKCYIEYQVQ